MSKLKHSPPAGMGAPGAGPRRAGLHPCRAGLRLYGAGLHPCRAGLRLYGAAAALCLALALLLASPGFATAKTHPFSPPSAAEEYFARGNRRLDEGAYAKAAAAYRQAIRLGLDRAEGYAQLALARRFLGDYAGAERNLRTAHERDPSNPAYLNNLAVLYEHTGRWNQAEQAYRRAIELAPHLAGTHLNLGNVLRRRKKYAAAVEAYKRYLVLAADSPLFPMASYQLGQVYALLGRRDEAGKYFETAALELESAFALELPRPGSRMYYILGQALRRLGRAEEAENALRRHLELSPQSAALGYYGLACLALGTGDEAEGRRLLGLALAPSPYRRVILLEARDEPDLNGVRGREWFMKLTGETVR